MTLAPPRPGSAAQRRFERAAEAAAYDPRDRWVGGYADYEWNHLRLALDAYRIDVAGRDVLEFGCNVGGSAVVLAALGARVQAVDIDPQLTAIAEANLTRYGQKGMVTRIDEGRVMPFASASFDLIVANSVLEYVDPSGIAMVADEFRRLLRPGGRLFICGTASRLAPRERHSGRWLVNLLPRFVDRLTGKSLQRGLSPWTLARALRDGFTADDGDGWLLARQSIHGRSSLAVRVLARLGRLIGHTPGWFAPTIELSLRRD
ncbi:hypothetical protein ASE00_04025 [Sphingomonas sp. Root710]|uniref:class I SAM-dependent methyltransferase n=1 Tax=Sphingomonas sp. Root710 TaxID=1736594 RepID=UPI0006FE418E|nr:class I SAM-dependent methyltransferase [Sphingomonas sp. Root710]KRB85927.1 hypothetical protein ASE00_04025 [Sphingomonas sp. Root710]